MIALYLEMVGEKSNELARARLAEFKRALENLIRIFTVESSE